MRGKTLRKERLLDDDVVKLTCKVTCRYDTWTPPEKAALMGGRGRFALQTILLDTFLTVEDLRLRSMLAFRKKMERLTSKESKSRVGACIQ
mmetsp:Transcript_3241/g.20145  ORF Transcript_3241/g.20145 Transcript_3241/m.20145 type:complete len:91 (+) Transcript_3241:104-376(+)